MPYGGYITVIYPYKSQPEFDAKEFVKNEAIQMGKNFKIEQPPEGISFTTYQNNPAASFSGEGQYSAMGSMHFECRLYLVEKHVVQLITFAKKEDLERFDAKRFMESFRKVEN